jgi:hypothetical protein
VGRNKVECEKVRRNDEEGEEEGGEDQNGLDVPNVFKLQKTVENYTETRNRGKCMKYNTTKL